jgi:light-regulated signal transduction histidine kinase (bacteriophytochrome)
MLEQDFASQLPDEARRLLSHVTSGAHRMGQIIDDLLRLSALGRQPLIKTELKLGSRVGELVEELKREQPQRQIEVVVDHLPDAMGDLSLVRQVFVNLLSNGFKFTRRREQARIEVGSESRDQDTLYFVRDNGAGFDMRFADRLFGVFQRMHKAEDFEGSGIGLSIVQRIVHRHGGRIWAEAEPGKGATFRFTLGSSGDLIGSPAVTPRVTAVSSTPASLGASSTTD